ncbi:MAG: flagellar FlbD family protein [bacterium]|nr:flagellar FlbD family protein [bacterium]
MIKVTRLNGREFFINPHQIENFEATPDTVITLTNGPKYIVKEDVETIISRIIEYRQKLGMGGNED